MSSPNLQISILKTARQWWKHAASCEGPWRATWRLVRVLYGFVRDSTPERLRSRFGDADYDWDYRVNTTSGAVGWRDRLLGEFHSAYQPTDPAAFHEMIEALGGQPNFHFTDFTFVDLGSGKGRTLLMASAYAFRRIIGVELLPSLHQIALDNLAQYKSETQKCFALESVCADATEFPLPSNPLVVYLFNPFPEFGMRKVVSQLAQSLKLNPRPAYVLYHNPLLEHTLTEGTALKRIARTDQYSIFAATDHV